RFDLSHSILRHWRCQPPNRGRPCNARCYAPLTRERHRRLDSRMIMAWPAPLAAVWIGSLTFARGADRWVSWFWGSIWARTRAAWQVGMHRAGLFCGVGCGGVRWRALAEVLNAASWR